MANEPSIGANVSLEVYPNPAHEKNFVRYALDGQRQGIIRLLDLEGHELKRVYLQQQQGVETLDLALPAGMYFVVLEADGQRVSTQKLIRF